MFSPDKKGALMITILIRWLIFLHILSALTFYMAHGTSAAMTFKMRKETDFVRIRALLDLSWSTMIIMGVSFLIMGLTGIALPFLIHIWNKVWIWASIVLMIIVFIYMTAFNETHYKELRRLVGLPYMKGNKELPAGPPSSPEEVAALLRKTNTTGLVVVGYVIPAIVLWLMIFKPF
jgi:ABC-type siderophore export system fused ATPase/permease subunit